ncbi:uncharacterized protein BDR25DRAFT_53891 [Lindgomyces ingoldianus]|uniref:Uncharacterized protein n=1 Tax=Lindgomyces ingoldianus TaxID=673940 RepID=A0ACB6QPI7_9PLEO|nr:uncharacterized protein BDR25DRAFT_53891 [Lindgomyces ingoldianus]KAF2468894.1 hypothetical protein BDR25DRAFT_53891 [Lindgomyces ingoldianus]
MVSRVSMRFTASPCRHSSSRSAFPISITLARHSMARFDYALIQTSPQHPLGLFTWQKWGRMVTERMGRAKVNFFACFTTLASLIGLLFRNHFSLAVGM